VPQSQNDDLVNGFIHGMMVHVKWSASNVDRIALQLGEAISSNRDRKKYARARMKDGFKSSALWVYLRGSRYVFCYEHSAGTIEMRAKFLNGALLHTFSNATPLEELESVFASL
jgi:hypothetical protein